MLLLYLHSAQLDTADLHYQWLGATFCCHLGCAATENAYYIFVQCSAFCEIWGSHLQALEQATSNLLSAEPPYVGRPFAPFLTAFSVMMRISGRRFTPCTTLEFSHHLLRYVALTICVCLRRFLSWSHKHGILIPFDSLLMCGQSLNIT